MPSFIMSVQVGGTHISFVVSQTAPPVHCAFEMQPTHVPAFAPEPQTVPPFVEQGVPGATDIGAFEPAAHMSAVQSLPSSRGSLSSTVIVEPEPSHTINLQSPGVWPLGAGVLAATAVEPHVPAVQVGCSHALVAAGQSRAASVHSTHAPLPSHSLPPASVQGVPFAAFSVPQLPPLHVGVAQTVVLAGQSVVTSLHELEFLGSPVAHATTSARQRHSAWAQFRTGPTVHHITASSGTNARPDETSRSSARAVVPRSYDVRSFSRGLVDRLPRGSSPR